MSDSLPPIHTWWPYLTAEARNDGLRDPNAPLTARVREESAQRTGADLAEGTRLDERDRQFVAQQTEIVD